MTRIPISILLVIAGAVLTTSHIIENFHHRHPHEHDDNKPWDYLLFVQRWPPSVCGSDSNECDFPANLTTTRNWVVHGLWPNYNDGTWPQFCDQSDTFDVSKVESVRAELEQRWPNLEEGQTEESLWAHEWEKHGTCAKTLDALGDEGKYFSSSLNMTDMYHIGNAFAKNGIVPSDTNSYTREQIEAALRDNIGNGSDLFDLACGRGTLPSGGDDGKVAMLIEARACIDKQLGIMTCPDASAAEEEELSMTFVQRAKRTLFGIFSWAPQSPPLIGDDGDACPDDGIYLPTFQQQQQY